MVHGFVDRQQLVGRLGCDDLIGIKLLPDKLPAMPEPALASSVLDQDSPHRFGGRGEEVAAAVPGLLRVLTHQPQVGFVDQGRAGKGLPKCLVSELSLCQEGAARRRRAGAIGGRPGALRGSAPSGSG